MRGPFATAAFAAVTRSAGVALTMFAVTACASGGDDDQPVDPASICGPNAVKRSPQCDAVEKQCEIAVVDRPEVCDKIAIPAPDAGAQDWQCYCQTQGDGRDYPAPADVDLSDLLCGPDYLGRVRTVGDAAKDVAAACAEQSRQPCKCACARHPIYSLGPHSDDPDRACWARASAEPAVPYDAGPPLLPWSCACRTTNANGVPAPFFTTCLGGNLICAAEGDDPAAAVVAEHGPDWTCECKLPDPPPSYCTRVPLPACMTRPGGF